MAAETEESGGQDKNGRVGMYRRAMCKRHGEKLLVFTTNRDPSWTCEEPKTRNAASIIRVAKIRDVSLRCFFDADYFSSDCFQ